MSHTGDSASLVHNHILYNEKIECQRGLTRQGSDLGKETRTKVLQLPTFIYTIEHESIWSSQSSNREKLSQVFQLVGQFVQ